MEWASVRAWMVIREPFITVSVANCEGRRKKRGGGGKRETKEKSRRKGRREEGLGSSQGEGRTNVLCGGLHPWRSHGHPLVHVRLPQAFWTLWIVPVTTALTWEHHLAQTRK